MDLMDDCIMEAWSKALDATTVVTAVPEGPKYYEIMQARSHAERAAESGDRDKLREAVSEVARLNQLHTDLVKQKKRAVEAAFSARHAAVLLTRKAIAALIKDCGLRIDRLCRENLIEEMIVPAMLPREVAALYDRANKAARILTEGVMSLPNEMASGAPVQGVVAYIGVHYRKAVGMWAGFQVREMTAAGAA
jgi:hypothetical protein